MSPQVLAHKLQYTRDANPQQAWNMARWPHRFSTQGQKHRLFVANRGHWKGYFDICDEALYLPETTTPYVLLFDTRTWTPIEPVPVKPFRGFTYDVPKPLPVLP